METVFLAIFVFGLASVVLSFVLGFGEVDLPGLSDLELGPFGAEGSDTGVSPFNVTTLLAFLTWFGGIGYLLSAQSSMGAPFVLAISTLAGLLGAAIVYMLFARWLLPGQTAPMRAEDFRLEGTLARVTVPITGTRTGEVVFVKGGATRSEGARSADGAALPRGCEVVILRYEKGIAHVEPLDKLLAEHDSRLAELSDRN